MFVCFEIIFTLELVIFEVKICSFWF